MSEKLLKATAQAFEDGRSLDGNFLRENNVSADDCIAWMNQVAAIIRGYLNAPKDIQNTLLASGVMPQQRMGQQVWFIGIQDWAQKQLSKELDKRIEAMNSVSVSGKEERDANGA